LIIESNVPAEPSAATFKAGHKQRSMPKNDNSLQSIIHLHKGCYPSQAIILFSILLFITSSMSAQSVYTQRPNDPGAHYFSPASLEGDVSEALQLAINRLKKEKNYGVLFIQEGEYRISKTIHVPKAIRIIGYGKKRPVFILGERTEGFQEDYNYMFWFTSNLVEEGEEARDANPGTFYSAISNIDFRIEAGNPKAIALRTHFAQHSFVSHCNFYIGEGYAGIYDLGNEIENLKFYGGEYGISSSRTSPGWPMLMIDLYFVGQRRAAVLSRNTGMAIIAMQVDNVPVAVELQEGVADRLFMEDCLFKNVKKGVVVGVDNQAGSQVNLLNVICQNVEVPVYFTASGKSIAGKSGPYVIKNFVHGLVMEDMADDSRYKTISELSEMDRTLANLDKVIPYLPSMDTWVNVKELGVAGDGKTDDTQAVQAAIANHKHLYFPTGWYRITKTIKLNKGTKLMGLHPYATQFVLEESEANFSGFGPPVPVLESSVGGEDMVNGIGISTGAYNNRAVALKWMTSTSSMVNDVKIVGGHGSMPKPGQAPHRRPRNDGISSPDEPVYESGMDKAWDNQYWSIWVTNGGGGILKDIWTANTYASCGLYISNTATPGRVYAMSLEHHVRQEARLNKAANWKFYAFQFEEEGKEGKNAQTLDVNDCKDLMFANFWMYRTIRVNTPRPWGVKVSNSRNIDFRNMRSWTQVLPLPERTLYDMDKNLIVYPGDFARAYITGNEKADKASDAAVEQLGFGYEFATGATSDSKGNVYFCDQLQKRVYKWSAATNTIAIYADYPYPPLSLAVDTEDNLIVICRYDPQPGFEEDNPPQLIENFADNNPYYSGWGNGGWAVLAYAIAPDKTDDMQPLPLSKTSTVEKVQRVIHPTHRWRGDFEKTATTLAERSFVAPDGVTIIPYTFDLSRSVQLMAVQPNQSQPVFVTHENPKITYQFQVDGQGGLSKMRKFVARGEYANVYDGKGRLFLAEGQLLILDSNGKEVQRIKLQERTQSLAWGGVDNGELFVTTSNALYRVRLEEVE
jgi:hypothetical protein